MIYIITLQMKLDQGDHCKLTTRTIGNFVGARFDSLKGQKHENFFKTETEGV